MLAQDLTKAEKKSLKKELRTYLKDPIKFKYLKDNLAVKDVIIKEQLNDLSEVSTEKKELSARLNAARDSIGFYENKLAKYVSAQVSSVSCRDDSGLKYRVQIGLYKDFDITSFFSEIKVLNFEQIEGEFRYTIGNFTTENDAELFKAAIRKMGIKGAFVSYYLDGERIPK